MITRMIQEIRGYLTMAVWGISVRLLTVIIRRFGIIIENPESYLFKFIIGTPWIGRKQKHAVNLRIIF